MYEKKYTDGCYTKNNPTFNDNESELKAKSLLRLLEKSDIDFSKIKSVLDVGCGGGGVLVALDKLTSGRLDLRGIDLNPDAIKYAKDRTIDNSNINFSNLDIATLNESFDLSMAIHVFEHIVDIHGFLNNLGKVSDLVYLAVPIEASVWNTFRKNVLLHQYERYGHIHFFNEPYFEKLLDDFGFEVIGRGYSDEFKAFDTALAKLIKYPRIILGYFSEKIACNFLGGYCYQVLIVRKSAHDDF